mmetsp:Transcript_33447/g.78912  ORF Transcript_33447/g.78912 Transcript_33447/m.78912 type:complete len:283 (+) Transcript_33447:693-1541(+)
MVSSLWMPWAEACSSNLMKRRSSISETCVVFSWELSVVKPTMSQKSTVAHSLWSSGARPPFISASATCFGNMSYTIPLPRPVFPLLAALLSWFSVPSCTPAPPTMSCRRDICVEKSLGLKPASKPRISAKLGRSSGSCDQQLAIMRLMGFGAPPGTSGRLCASLLMTPITTAVALSPSYGGFRDKSSHSTTPNEYASDCFVGEPPSSTSGAIQNRVPSMPLLEEKPKSDTLARNRSSTRMFPALRSPWMIGGECEWMKCMPAAMSVRIGCIKSPSSSIISLR